MPFLLVGPWNGTRPGPTMTLRVDVTYGLHRGILLIASHRIFNLPLNNDTLMNCISVRTLQYFTILNWIVIT